MSADLEEIIRRLVTAYQPEAIYLFGSHARGDARPDSDYDVLVVLQADPSLATSALYHCQQAAEKAMKGFLVWHGQ